MRRGFRLAFAGSLSASVVASFVHRPALCRDARMESFTSRLSSIERAMPAVATSTDMPPPSARLIDGKAIAQTIRTEIRDETQQLINEHGVTPGLAVVLVGNRTDSSTYVRMKKRAAAEVGFYSVDKEFPETVGQEELLACIRVLNDDPKVASCARPCTRARRLT